MSSREASSSRLSRMRITSSLAAFMRRFYLKPGTGPSLLRTKGVGRLRHSVAPTADETAGRAGSSPAGRPRGADRLQLLRGLSGRRPPGPYKAAKLAVRRGSHGDRQADRAP